MTPLIHQRIDKTATRIFSKLTIPWLNTQVPDIFGIELPDKNNQHDISCIPAGIYKCVPYFSPKRQQKCWLLLDVPGRDNIEIHSGNFASTVKLASGTHIPDTDGCLMYGFTMDARTPMIGKSKECMAYLYTMLGLNIDENKKVTGSEFLIDIRN